MLVGRHDRALEEGQICVLLVGEVALPDEFRPELVDVPGVALSIFRRIGSLPDAHIVSAREYWNDAGSEGPHQSDERDDFFDPGQIVVPVTLARIPGFCTGLDGSFLFRLGIPEVETADLDERHEMPH